VRNIRKLFASIEQRRTTNVNTYHLTYGCMYIKGVQHHMIKKKNEIN